MPELIDLTHTIEDDTSSSTNSSTNSPRTIILTDPNSPLTAPINQPLTSDPRSGKHYQTFVESGLAHKLATSQITQSDCATELSLSQRTISGYINNYIHTLRTELQTSSWKLNPQHARLLKVENFPQFRRKYFKTPKGKPYITKPYHMRWIKAILEAISTGGKLTILSPPRHGKTELLIHFVIWMLIRNPNIRILWIGGNGDIAEDAVGLVKDELESNEKLIHDFLPPGGSFKPLGSKSVMWNRSKVKLATRSLSMKSMSLRAMGRGYRILSLDADLIITDDLDDADSVASPAVREQTQAWWDQNLTTRKEHETAWVNIGSRQHPDDIHNKTLEDETWTHIVEQAYDITEEDLPRHETPAQVPSTHGPDCLTCKKWDEGGLTLFPEIRPMWYLMDTFKSIGMRRFSMIYLNDVDHKGVVIFPKRITEQCKNPKRSILNFSQIPELEVDPINYPGWKTQYTHKVGGLDPSGSTGYQAAVIWAFNIPCNKQYLIDVEAERGGGIAEAFATIKKYYEGIKDEDGNVTFEPLSIRHWVIEENLYQGGIIKDRDISDYCSSNGIILEGHLTYTNKWDPDIGVTSLAPLFDNRVIDLPYKDEESQAITDTLIKQLKNFEGKMTKAQKKKTAKSDIVMAAWFPQTVYRRLRLEFEAENNEDIETDYEQTPYPDSMMGDVYELASAGGPEDLIRNLMRAEIRDRAAR